MQAQPVAAAAAPVDFVQTQQHWRLQQITQRLLVQAARRGLPHLDHKAIVVALRSLIRLVRLEGVVAVRQRPQLTALQVAQGVVDIRLQVLLVQETHLALRPVKVTQAVSAQQTELLLHRRAAAAEKVRSAVQGQLAHRQTVQVASGKSVPLRGQVFIMRLAAAARQTVQPQQAAQGAQVAVVLAGRPAWRPAFQEQ